MQRVVRVAMFLPHCRILQLAFDYWRQPKKLVFMTKSLAPSFIMTIALSSPMQPDTITKGMTSSVSRTLHALLALNRAG